MGNWDAVGSGLNNVVVLADGTLARIDSGGTFFFRAKAGRKGAEFIDEITEWENFVDKNRDYRAVFEKAGLHRAEDLGDRLKQQLQKLEIAFGSKAKREEFLREVFRSAGRPSEIDQLVTRYEKHLGTRLQKIRDRVEMATKPMPKPTPYVLKPVPAGEVDLRYKPEDADKLVLERVSKDQQNAERKIGPWVRNNRWTEAERVQAEANLQALIDKSHVCRNIRSNDFEKVLKDGRFKSQFETHTSGGCLDPSFRARIENQLFGLPNDPAWDVKNRPIYGSLVTDMAGEHGATSYGDVLVRFKAGIKGRTTAVGTDSFGVGSDFQPAPLTHPSLRMVGDYHRSHLRNGVPNTAKDLSTSYFEVQIHGGATVEDIAEVVFSSEPSPFLKTRLNELQIPWRIRSRRSY